MLKGLTAVSRTKQSVIVSSVFALCPTGRHEMSSQGARRRCIIQKLDFENCIITNIKTTARGRKKLRARITREFEEITDVPEEQQPSSSQAPPQGSTSPVLIKRQCRDGSPVFAKRKKISFQEEDVEKPPDDTIIEEVYSTPGSPVFKMHKKPKPSNPSQELQSVLGRMTSLDFTFHSQENSNSSIQIDEFTQESKRSDKISSFESSDVKNESIYSIESGLHTSWRGSPGERVSDSFNSRESPKSFRRNHKKNSLLGRLQILQQKRASEKLLWQHQNRKNSSSSLKFSVDSFWAEEFYYFLKCRSLLSKPETNFLIVDSRWVPNVKTVTEGSMLQLHPPWQKIQVNESTITVLLNVICLDILEGTEEPVAQKETFESVSINDLEINEKSFVDSLFPADSSGFL